MATRTDDTDDRDRARSEERYQQLLRTVEANTGGPGERQRAGIRRPHLDVILVAHGPHRPEELDQSIRAALEDGRGGPDLVEYPDQDGIPRLARRTVAGVRAIVAEQNMREEPDVELQEWCAGILEDLRDD